MSGQRRYVTTHEERVRQSFSRQAFMSTLGAELAAVAQGGVKIALPFSPNLTQQNGYLHAGAVTAVLDSACGYAALTVAAEDKEVLTVEFKVNLLAPAAAGGPSGPSASEESGTDADSLYSGCLCHQRRQREGGCNHAGHNHGSADNPREIARAATTVSHRIHWWKRYVVTRRLHGGCARLLHVVHSRRNGLRRR